MSSEPTAEQKKDAQDFMTSVYSYDNDDDIAELAALIAEREAELIAEREALVGALRKAALRNSPEDGPCFCTVPIPADTAHHLSCQHIRSVLAKAGAR